MGAIDDVVNALDEDEIEKVRRIVIEATEARRPQEKSKLEYRLDGLSSWMMSHGTAGFVISLLMAFIAGYTQSRPLGRSAMVLALLVQVFGLGLLFVPIIGGAVFFWQLRKSPYKPFYSLVKSSAEMDVLFVNRLCQCDKRAIQYVLAYYKYERNGLEKRSSLFCGSVERIGLLPAIAALIVLMSSLAKISEVATWAVMLGPLIFIFYLMNIGIFQMTQRMDRVIAMLEYCIQSRK